MGFLRCTERRLRFPFPGGLNGLEKIVPGSKAWQSLVWGDFTDSPNRGRVGHAPGRPRYDRSYFDFVMNQYGKKVLIRSHQPDIPHTVFDKRCLTIMSLKSAGLPPPGCRRRSGKVRYCISI